MKWLMLSMCSVLAGGGTNLACADEFMSGGVKIHYTDTGYGPPVILIHGLGSNVRMNWEMPGTLAQLSKHYRVIALDNRGHGQSGKPEQEGQYGVEMVQDVVRLMDRLHVPKAQVVGYSMGGMIALKLAVLHPDRVSAVVLGGMGWLQSDTPLQHFWEAMQGRGLSHVPAACIHGIAALAVSEADLKGVRVPVTILVGERDVCRRLYVEPLAKVRPDWPVHVIPDAGHINCVGKAEFKTQLAAALKN
ncbi:MAG TPA: alpha/beta hydrolase [Candidatus Acidoferrum sp.]|nr:alpha/beta hydrolase [Candidatus Acidoferrum sp.]